MLNGHRPTPSPFRPAALERYLSNREEAVLPHYLGSQTFLTLWLVLALLFSAVLALGLLQVPVHISGTALVTPMTGDGQAHFLFLLPPESLAIVTGGQAATVYLQDRPFDTTITNVETELTNTPAIIEQFHLNPDIDQLPVGPTLIATASMNQHSGSENSLYRVDVKVGSRRLVSFLPFIGPLF